MTSIRVPHFVARSAGATGSPGIVLIHDSFGIRSALLRFAQRLAREGYAIVAPDLYYRIGGTKSARWSDRRSSLQRREVLSDLKETVQLLCDLGSLRIGVVAFCLGGWLGYRMASESHDIGGAVCFYGAGVNNELGRELQCPVQHKPW
jgi:carboxymethylenebutenolidase